MPVSFLGILLYPEAVVAGNAVLKGQETAQKRELGLAKNGHADPAIGPAQHRAQAQQQHLIERVEHLFRLPRIGKFLKMFKKINLPADAKGFIVFHVHTFRLRTRWKARITDRHTALPEIHSIALCASISCTNAPSTTSQNPSQAQT